MEYMHTFVTAYFNDIKPVIDRLPRLNLATENPGARTEDGE